MSSQKCSRLGPHHHPAWGSDCESHRGALVGVPGPSKGSSLVCVRSQRADQLRMVYGSRTLVLCLVPSHVPFMALNCSTELRVKLSCVSLLC